MIVASKIYDISTQLRAVCDKICSLSNGISRVSVSDNQLGEVYNDLLLDEIHHAQLLTLELTRASIGTEHTDDGSAFAEGELNSVEGKQEKDKPESADTEEV